MFHQKVSVIVPYLMLVLIHVLIRHYKNQSIKQNLHGAFITLTYYLVLMMKLQVRGVDYLKLAETKVTSVITFFKLEKMKMNFV